MSGPSSSAAATGAALDPAPIEKTSERNREASASLWRNTAAIAVARLGSVAFDGITYILTARYFGPSEYGNYLAVLAFLNLVDVAADMTLMDVSVREMSLSPKLAGGWLGASTVLRLALALVGMAGFGVYLAFTGHWQGGLAAAAMAALILPAGGFRMPLALFRARMMMHYELGIVLATRFFNLAIVLVLIQQKAGLSYFFAGTLASRVLLAVMAWTCVFLIFKPQVTVAFRQIKQLARESVPMGLSGLFVATQLKADILIVAAFAGATAAGLYGSVAQLPEYSLYVPVIITTPMLPILSQAFAQAERSSFQQFFQKMWDSVLIVSMPLAVVGIVAPAACVALLFGDEYQPVAHLLPLLVLSIVAMWVSHATAIATVAAGLQSNFIWIQTVCILVYLLLNYLSIPLWGATAAAAVRLVTTAIAPVLTYWIIRRRIGLRIGFGSMWRIGSAAGLMALVLLACGSLPLLVSASIACGFYGATLWLMRPRSASMVGI